METIIVGAQYRDGQGCLWRVQSAERLKDVRVRSSFGDIRRFHWAHFIGAFDLVTG